jgi:dCTP deaminase
MAFWNSEKIKQKATDGSLIAPYDEKRIKHGAYELSLGPEIFITSSTTRTKQNLVPHEQIVIPPGQFGLLLTEETVTIPNEAIGFISIKASIKFRGLVNVSGFHVDPEFSGRLKFAVYNAGSQNIVLAQGQPVFLIWFSDLVGPTTDGYKGDHNNQQRIISDDVMRIQGEVSSPAELKAQIDEIRKVVRDVRQWQENHREFRSMLWSSLIAGVVGGLVVFGIVFGIQRYNESKLVTNTPSTSEASQPKQKIELKKDTSQSANKTKPASKE